MQRESYWFDNALFCYSTVCTACSSSQCCIVCGLHRPSAKSYYKAGRNQSCYPPWTLILSGQEVCCFGNCMTSDGQTRDETNNRITKAQMKSFSLYNLKCDVGYPRLKSSMVHTLTTFGLLMRPKSTDCTSYTMETSKVSGELGKTQLHRSNMRMQGRVRHIPNHAIFQIISEQCPNHSEKSLSQPFETLFPYAGKLIHLKTSYLCLLTCRLGYL